MLNYKKILFLSLFIKCILLNAQGLIIPEPLSQETQSVKKEDRFIATINNAPIKDEFELMTSYSLQIQWWTLLGEPIEYYTIKWESSGKYTIDNETVTRNQLIKYPDLLKRFDNLQPSKMEIKIEGYADAGRVVVKRGELPSTFGFKTRKGFPFKKNGQAYDEYFLSADFCYIVEDPKLLYTKSGELGEGIVPGSPHWNEFLHWGDKDYWSKKNKNDKTLLKQNKLQFNKANKISISSKIVKLEWNLTEMRSIFDLYKKYESGELEPSPIEEVKEKTEKETKDLTTYTKNDFWSKIEKPKEISYVSFKGANGKYGIKIVGSEKVTLPPTKYYINTYPLAKIGSKTYFVTSPYTTSMVTPAMKRNRKILIDQFGNSSPLPDKYLLILGNRNEKKIYTRKITSIDSKCNLRGTLSGYKANRVTETRNTYDYNFRLISSKKKSVIINCKKLW